MTANTEPEFNIIEVLQRSANLGQVYGLASAMRTCAEEASALSGLCLEQSHGEAIGRIAKQADLVCRQIMIEWDRMKSQLRAQKNGETVE